jgi:predicted nucleotidyltransferase
MWMLQMVTKPVRRAESKEVIYDDTRWVLLQEYREKAENIMAALESACLQTLAHGSLARGDVTKKSDVDIHLRGPVSSFPVETALEKAKIRFNSRQLLQATPTYAIKAYIEIDSKTSISFSLTRMRKVESEFFKFGGEANLEQLKMKERVAGVDKRLMLIEPTERGHIESSIIGREEEAAKILGISTETVRERVRVLLKRDEVGRTGVFIKRELSADETFEMALRRLARENPALRRKVKKIGYEG